MGSMSNSMIVLGSRLDPYRLKSLGVDKAY
jgi:hypothetical protein